MSNDDWRDALGSLLGEGVLPEGEAAAPQPDAPSRPKRQKLVIAMEKKGRAGKTATIISGFDMPQGELESLAAKLKQRLGAGGSARGGEILIQGDRRKDIASYLRSLGYDAKA